MKLKKNCTSLKKYIFQVIQIMLLLKIFSGNLRVKSGLTIIIAHIHTHLSECDHCKEKRQGIKTMSN